MNPLAIETPRRVEPDVPFLAWNHEDFHQSIARRFEQQVRQHPESVAVRSATGSFTYDQLNRAANRLAHTLLAHDNRLSQRVAILMAHDAPQTAAMLGVLKSGKVCVVLSSAHPETRLVHVLENAGADVLVTDAKHALLAASVVGTSRCVINAEALESALSVENPSLEFPPETLAFIIYTSGSTGQPRGVMQSHRNILHNIRRHTHGLHLNAADRICLLSSASAGQGMATVFCALLNGATLCPRDLAEESVAGLAGWLIREEITVYVSAASVFRHFVRTLTGQEKFPRLRLVRLASEPVHKSDLELFQSRFAPDCFFANTYSSTETGNLCAFLCDQNAPLPGDVMPIGYAAEDVQILLLDENGQPASVGEVGEIVARSRYLSPGYWNDPDQTRAAFETMPGSEERIYRTRDLARMDAHGRLEHFGRKDTQVKIRGFRVYPDEVRNRLCQHDAVSEAVVDVRVDAGGNARLVAYFIAANGTAPAPRELRRHLKESLPEFMVPSAYVPLEMFPRTPNGKVDRAVLREIKLENAAAADAAAKPKTAVEELLANVWAEVLNLNAVGINDNFFELGGDSLLVTQLVFRINEVLRLDVPATLLFEKPTIAELSVEIQQRQQGEQTVQMPPIRPAPRGEPMPLSFVQERNWRQSQSLRDNLSNLLANGYVLDGQLDVEALQRSLDELVRRHEPLRTTYHQRNGGLVQIIGEARPVKMPFVDLRNHPCAEEEADRLWGEEARRPVDLARGPMLRATLLRLQETRHWLLITVHHIISDAWSRDNLLRDLGVLYAAFSHGRPSPLPEPELHAADFAVWQRELLRPDGPLYQTQLAYWKKQLAQPPSKIELPFKRARLPVDPDYREGRRRWIISPDVARQLGVIGREEGATLFMTRLAAFAVQLHGLTGAEDFVVATYMTNRNRPETQGMIGFFSNLVMLRLNLKGDPTFRELLARVRTTTLEATAHSDISFDELCADLKSQGTRPPKIQIIFEIKYGETEMRFGDLAVRRMDRKTSTMPWGFQLSVLNKGDQSQGFLLFDLNLYQPEGVMNTLANLQTLLAGIATNPDRRLSELCPNGPKRRRWFFSF